jgi:amino acid adenylation domain-containing protein
MEQRTACAAPDSRLPTLIEASVRAHPDALALVDGKLRLTYAQLDSRAEAAARGLRALGIGPGAVVGLAARRSADTVAALLGVLKAGAAYCPLDLTYPLERLRFMLEDSGAAALVAGPVDARKLSDPARPTVSLDGSSDPGAARAAAAPRAARPEDLAYVIYTSGSTGKPKGVMVEHAAAVNFVPAMMKLTGISSGERSLFFSSMSFDGSVGELFPCLLAGGAIFLRGESLLPARDFIRSIEEMGINRLFVPTAYWHELAATLAPLGETLPACLRTVAVGGEALRAESLAFWRPVAGHTRLINVYGPTEATVWTSFYEVPADAPPSGIVPIGRPFGGSELRVIDSEGRPVPDGFAGELWIGGPGVARGYLNRPELTAQRFLPDPFSEKAGARAYRTGDRVRRRPDGALEYLGRFDDQVKIRGFRVELGEVESSLASHPAVGTCAVVLREETPGVQRLVAYVSPSAGSAVSSAVLRAFLLEKIPEYMVPAVIVALASLPLTPAGKVDRRALPPPPAPAASETPHERTPTPLERQIRGIWEEVLGRAPIGLSDDFAALGGHSLLAVRIMAKIEKALGRRPPLEALVGGMSIERLAAAMSEGRRDATVPIIRFGPEVGAEPFFFVHPGLGGFYCKELSRAMPDRPFYLLGGQNLTGVDPIPTIEEMAGRYLETLRKVRPRGPYHLGGYSIGCMIAYEMARQLENAGEPVPKLMLVAAPIDDSVQWWSAVRRGAGLVRGLLGYDQSAMLNHFNLLGKSGELIAGLFKRGGAARLWEALHRARTRVAKEGSIRAFGPNAQEFNDTLKVLQWAGAAYRPGAYRGSLMLFEVKERFLRRSIAEFRRLAPAAEQVHLPGDHDEVVTTYTAELGKEIGRRLT